MSAETVPLKKCDVVMKGGITSGVVYPGLICKLAERYQFQCIGGTSAGAIAAALTAAAEFARTKGENTFDKVAEVPTWLGQQYKPGAGSNLLNLFQPQKEMKVLFRVVSIFLLKSWLGRMAALTRALWFEIVLGLLPLGLFLGTMTSGELWQLILNSIVIAFLAVTGIGLACVLGILLRARLLPKHHFGFCTGWMSPTVRQPRSLIQWLHDEIQDVAKLPQERPLTFGDLKRSGITLKMIATCLTFGRPYTLPFESLEFYFCPSEMKQFFPPEVVQWMVDHPGEPSKHEEKIDTRGLVRLPDGDHLPVILATRLSLSFPFLFCAVPLYAVDWSRRRRKPGESLPTTRVPGDALGPDELRQPESVWFSDGGICSNFPLHLFDSPIPKWPTFGINLRDLRPDRSDRVWMAKTNRDGISPTWTRIATDPSVTGIGSLFSMMFDAARNWMDNLQATTPGYRDRIVHIFLDKVEGGLNLNMPDEIVTALSGYGEQAGSKLTARFIEGVDIVDGESFETEMTWDNQRWIRYRSTMALLEAFLANFSFSVAHPESGDRTIFELIDRGPDDPPSSYPFTAQQKTTASERTTALDHLAQRSPSLVPGAPKPSPALRVRPTF
jgi:predicted acylesterase/phospholipase RssA